MDGAWAKINKGMEKVDTPDLQAKFEDFKGLLQQTSAATEEEETTTTDGSFFMIDKTHQRW